MKRFVFYIACVTCCVTATCAETYYNDQCKFSFTLPDNCRVIPDSVGKQEAYYFVQNTRTKEYVAYITYRNVYQKGKAMTYRATRKSVLSNDSTATIIEERPFYDLLRQEMTYTCLTSSGDTICERLMLKASSFISVRSFYPLSEDAQTVMSTFDNHKTFQGNLSHVRQNAGGIVMTIFLSLLAFVGYHTRNKEHRGLFAAISVLLFALVVVCLWQDVAVMGFVLGVSLLIWGFFFSHSKVLMWIIDSIFG